MLKERLIVRFLCVSVPIGFYGLQQYLSMLGSLILVPLVTVPAMGGSHVSVILYFDPFCFVCI